MWPYGIRGWDEERRPHLLPPPCASSWVCTFVGPHERHMFNKPHNSDARHSTGFHCWHLWNSDYSLLALLGPGYPILSWPHLTTHPLCNSPEVCQWLVYSPNPNVLPCSPGNMITHTAPPTPTSTIFPARFPKERLLLLFWGAKVRSLLCLTKWSLQLAVGTPQGSLPGLWIGSSTNTQIPSIFKLIPLLSFSWSETEHMCLPSLSWISPLPTAPRVRRDRFSSFLFLFG